MPHRGRAGSVEGLPLQLGLDCDETLVKAKEKITSDSGSSSSNAVSRSASPATGRQREIFQDTGLTARIGPDRFFPTVRAAIAAFESAHPRDASETGAS